MRSGCLLNRIRIIKLAVLRLDVGWVGERRCEGIFASGSNQLGRNDTTDRGLELG